MIKRPSKHQISLFSGYKHKWIKISSSTKETNELKIISPLSRIYKMVEKRLPKLIVVCESPLACLWSSNLLNSKKEISPQVIKDVKEKVYLKLISEFRGDFTETVWSGVRDRNTNQGSHHIKQAITAQLERLEHRMVS